MLSDKFELDVSANGSGSSVQGIVLDLIIFRIKQTIEMASAGVHAACHFGFADISLFHGMLDLPDKDSLLCSR